MDMILVLIKFVTPVLMIYSFQEGRTALSLASWLGQSDTVRILVQRGANTDVQDQVGDGKVEQ